jgi:hypothetical protein
MSSRRQSLRFTSLSTPATPTPIWYYIRSIMVKTRKQELSAEESPNTEQPEQTETATNEAPTTSEPADEKKEGDAASKARDRQARFKALQARAVSKTSGFAIRLTFRSRY